MGSKIGYDCGPGLISDGQGNLVARKRNGLPRKLLFHLLSAYGLTSLVSSLWLNPLGDFLSKAYTTTEAFFIQLPLFIALAIISYFLFRSFPLINRKLYLLLVYQLYLMLFAWRAYDVALAAGALLVSLSLTLYARRNWKRLDNRKTVLFWKTCFVMVDLVVLSAFLFQLVKQGGLMDHPLAPASRRPLMNRVDMASLLLGLTAAGTSAIIFYLIRERRGRISRKSRSCLLGGLLLVAFLPTLYLALVMFMRTKGMKAPTFDMGIFTQMFHNMRRIGAPVTTLERDQLLSHFKVHISPVFYLILPFFAIFPKAETLQLLQVFIVASSVIPLWLLTGRLLADFPVRRVLVLVVFLLQPAMLGSSLYDLHENCFLAPFLLWLIYFISSRKRTGVLLFTFLTLMIKEDAGLYLVALALFLLLGESIAKERVDKKKDAILAVAMISMSLLHFAASVWYLSVLGDGAMLYRYKNLLIHPSLGMPGIALSALQNPAYYLATMWARGKMNYILIVLGSLGFLPFIQRKAGNYVLFIPLIFMNLLSNYGYQYELAYQYHYGSGTLLIFLFVLALRNWPPLSEGFGLQRREKSVPWKRNKRIFTALIAFILAAGAGQSYFLLRERRHDVTYVKANKAEIEEIRVALAKIPVEDPVGATSNLTSPLATSFWLYDLDFHKKSLEDGHLTWLAFDNRLPGKRQEEMLESCLASGYVESDLSNGSVRILVWPASQEEVTIIVP